MQREYEMSEEDLRTLLAACQPVPYLIAGGMGPMTPQESANLAWKRLGEKMGFDYSTVEPVRGKGDRFFTAVPVQR